MNIFIQELKAYRKSTLIWIISLSTLVIIFLMLFPAFTKDAVLTQKILNNFPAAIRQAFDISLTNFFSINGFFAYLFSFIGLAGAIQAMNIGVGIISKEVSNKTADFLLTKPVSRIKVITSKVLAALTLLIFTNLVFSSIALGIAKIVSSASFDSKIFILISATLLLIQLFFLALGILLSVIIPKIKSVVTISMPVVFIFFIIGTLGAILGNDTVKYISPFKFFDPNYIINNGSYDIKFLIIEIIFIIITGITSYIIYINQDIKAAA